MIDNELKNILIGRLAGLNVNGLIKYMEESGAKYKKAKLRDAYGMSSIDTVYIDFDIIPNDFMLYFVIIHETSHYKRIKKLGVEKILENLSSDNFDYFNNFLLGEEIICDRYASLLYYHFNKKNYPKHLTQCLDRDINKEKYRQMIRSFHKKIENNEESFNKFIESFIIKKEIND